MFLPAAKPPLPTPLAVQCRLDWGGWVDKQSRSQLYELTGALQPPKPSDDRGRKATVICRRGKQHNKRPYGTHRQWTLRSHNFIFVRSMVQGIGDIIVRTVHLNLTLHGTMAFKRAQARWPKHKLTNTSLFPQGCVMCPNLLRIVYKQSPSGFYHMVRCFG